jgi:hypothetical protein
MHALMYLAQMQFTNIYMMMSTQTCASCFKMVSKKKKLKKKKTKKHNFFLMACCDKNVIHDSTIQKKRGQGVSTEANLFFSR